MHRIHRGGLALAIFGATPIFLLVTLVAWLFAGHAGVEYIESLAASTTAPPWTYKPLLPELGLPWALATTPPAILSIVCTVWGLHLMWEHNKKFTAFKQAMVGKPAKQRAYATKKSLDARLPKGLIVEKPGFKAVGKTYLDPGRDKIVVANKDNSRVRYHEKAHYIWERRMTPQQRNAWKNQVEDHLTRQTGVSATKAKRIARGRSRIKNGIDTGSDAEEMFAVVYAEHKLGRTPRNGLGRFMKAVTKGR